MTQLEQSGDVVETQEAHNDHARVIAPPPLIFVPMIVAGAVLQLFFSLELFPRMWIGHAAGWPMVAAGTLLVVWAVLTFRRAGEDVNAYKPTSAIVSRGPYAFSRNPMYISMVLIYVGISVIVNTLWPIIFLPASLIMMQYGVIFREEEYLKKVIGAEYQQYRASVRRWL